MVNELITVCYYCEPTLLGICFRPVNEAQADSSISNSSLQLSHKVQIKLLHNVWFEPNPRISLFGCTLL